MIFDTSNGITGNVVWATSWIGEVATQPQVLFNPVLAGAQLKLHFFDTLSVMQNCVIMAM